MITLKRSTTATREKTAGFIAFAGMVGDWEPHFVPYELDEATLQEVIAVLRPDGAINPSPLAAAMLRCPTVLTDGWAEETPYDALVTCDDGGIAQLAADHFLQRAFRQCAYIGSNFPQDIAHSNARREAFVRALRKNGYEGDLPCMDCDLFASMRERTPTRVVNWLKSLPKPCGLFVYNDFTCQYVMAACRGAGIKVPEQIGILGVDNEVEICENAKPTLSSIAPDFVGAGVRAAKLLDKFMREGRPCKPIVRRYGVKALHARMSTQGVAVSMKFVGMVMERIRLSEGRGLSVESLARDFGLSSRMLERRFKGGQGTSIRDEMMKARLAAVERLLTTTTMPIKDIPGLTGFGTGANLRHAFHKYRGMSLGRYRREYTLK